jgi:hypothetical protein
MSSQAPHVLNEPPDLEPALRELDQVLAILYALDEGALLAEPPPSHEARTRHQAAVVLIDLVRSRLRCVRRQLAEAASSGTGA